MDALVYNPADEPPDRPAPTRYKSGYNAVTVATGSASRLHVVSHSDLERLDCLIPTGVVGVVTFTVSCKALLPLQSTCVFTHRSPAVVASPTPTPTPSTPSSSPGVKDTFDLYVDGVDNICDSATIVKVTGRLINTGKLEGLPDIAAHPELDSSARCPRFKYRMVINDGKVTMATNMVLLLRVYTVEKQTGKLVVLGSCLFDIFDLQSVSETFQSRMKELGNWVFQCQT